MDFRGLCVRWAYKSHRETLKATGVTELAVYQKGKRIMVTLPV